MIYSDSRYASGTLVKTFDARKSNTSISLFRNFPNGTSGFFYYTWSERDRIDIIAERFLGNANLWWYIMDYNPELLNPQDIPVGSSIRIPNG